MGTVILIISAVLFISTFGIHSFISNGNEFDKNGTYMSDHNGVYFEFEI